MALRLLLIADRRGAKPSILRRWGSSTPPIPQTNLSARMHPFFCIAIRFVVTRAARPTRGAFLVQYV